MRDDQVPALWRGLGLPGLANIHVHFLPERMLHKVWAFFDSIDDLGEPWTITYRDDETTRLEAAREWSLWEGHVATLLPNEELLDSFGDPAKAVPFARICAKFFLENFFLEENELLNNVDKLAGIPGIIVQGRHDICTPPGAAWALKKAWPKAEFWIVHDAGHSAGEPGIIDGLVRATDSLAGKEG